MESKASKYLLAPSLIVSAFFSIITLLIMAFSHSLAVWLCSLTLVVLIPTFMTFLVAIARGKVGRSFLGTFTFIFTHISCILLLFARIHQLLGLKDSVNDVSKLGNNTSFVDALYFSTITWTTVGYGDITPLKPDRLAAALEAFTGYIVMGLLVSALIAIVRSEGKSSEVP